MVAGAKARRAIGTLPVFLDYLATDQAFASDSTTALLATAGLAVPRPEVYLPVRQVGVHYHDAADGMAAAESAFALIEGAEQPSIRANADSAAAIPSAASW